MRAHLIIDIIVLIVLLFRAYKGFNRGIINEIARLLAIIFGAIGSIFVSGFFSSLLSPFILNPAILGFVSLIVGFIFIAIIILMAGWITTKLLEAIYLGLLNKLLGLLFGLINGSLFCGLIIYLFYKYGILADEIKMSYFGQILMSTLGLQPPIK